MNMTEAETVFHFLIIMLHDMMHTILYARTVYGDNKKWSELRRSVMKVDFSWKQSALKYIELYKSMQY